MLQVLSWEIRGCQHQVAVLPFPDQPEIKGPFLEECSGQEHDADLAAAGQETFLMECSGCHMEDGTGDIYSGAPNLTDAIWLYGGDEETIRETVTYSRFGVMPAWSEEYRPAGGLTDSEVNAIATYVH